MVRKQKILDIIAVEEAERRGETTGFVWGAIFFSSLWMLVLIGVLHG